MRNGTFDEEEKSRAVRGVLAGGRYLLAGGILFVLDFLVFRFLYGTLHLDISVAQGIARTFGATAGFLLHKLYVFRDSGRSAYAIGAQGVGYALLVVWNVFFSSLLMRLASGAFPGAGLLVLKVAVEVVMVCETFAVLRFIFGRKADVR